MHRTMRAFLTRLTVCACLCTGLVFHLAVVPAAFSQVRPGEVKRLEPVVVTGSLIPMAELVGATPVDVYNSEDIARIGSQTVMQFLKTTSAWVGAGNWGESRGNGGDGSGAVSLRGISGGTLVLINGRRMATNQMQGVGNVDINAIPLGAIERIEVLKDGASALYGADAQAGVVNIILKRGFVGTEMFASYGNTTETDVGQQNYTFVTGLANEKFSLMVGGSYYKSNALYSVDRSRSFPGPGQVSGTSNPGRIRTSAAADPTGIIPSGGFVYDGAPGTTGSSPADYRAFNAATDLFPFAFFTPAIRPSERWSFFGTSSHELYEKYLTFFAEAMYSRTWSFNQLAPTPIVFQGLGITIPASNFYNPFGVDITNARYRSVENGPRTETNNSDNFRFVGGFKGEIAETPWNWEIAFLYSEDSRVQRQGGELSRSALEDAVADTGSLAFNPFGNRANSRAQLDQVAQTLVQTSMSTLFSFDGKIGGDLFELQSGMIKGVVGGSYFEEKALYRPDTPTAFGDTVGFNESQPFTGKRDVTSVFAEVAVPLFGKDFKAPALNSLEVSAAVRHDDYSDAGSTPNPKFTLRWQPMDESLTIRASYGHSFAAPSFQSLYFNGQSFPEIFNPFTSVFEQISTFIKGNPTLKPEKGESYTAGFVYSPSYVQGLTVSLEYYRLSIKDRIGTSTQFIIDENFRTGGPGVGVFSNLITFNSATNEYVAVDTPFLNLGQVKTDGLDMSAVYTLATESLGSFTWAVNATYMLTFERQTLPGLPFEDVLGDFTPEESDAFGFGSTPRLKGNLSQFWNYRNFEFGVIVNYVHSYRDYKPSGFDREIEAQTTFDLQLSYNFPQNTRVTIGVLNVADTEPPFAGGAFADNYDRDMHDLRQRFVYLNVLKRF